MRVVCAMPAILLPCQAWRQGHGNGAKQADIWPKQQPFDRLYGGRARGRGSLRSTLARLNALRSCALSRGLRNTAGRPSAFRSRSEGALSLKHFASNCDCASAFDAGDAKDDDGAGVTEDAEVDGAED